MTGIERLRRLARSQNMDNAWTAMLANELCDIAGQIEREQDALVKDSPYDALPPDERDAIAWVREHGGVATVKEEWNHSRNLKRQLETAQAKVERQQRHIEDVQSKLTERNERIAELKSMIDVRERANQQLNDELNAMRPRLMPEGMEWPRFEDGGPVRIGDEVVLADNEPHEVESIEFFADKSCKLKGKGTPWMNTIFKGQVAMRPATKVLDSDGAEIRVGDTVWSTREPKSGTVVYAYPPGDDGQPSVKVGAFWHHASELTHRAPVLAADGRPLREGETVYLTDSPTAFVVDDIMAREDGATVVHLKDGAWHRPQDLTHERPDSLERFEADCDAISEAEADEASLYAALADYCARRGLFGDDHISLVARDLARRARSFEGRA